MNYAALLDEVLNDPTGRGYSAHFPDSPGRVCDLLNEQSAQMVKPRFITIRTMLAEIPDGDGGVIAEKLVVFGESASSEIPQVEKLRLNVKHALGFIRAEGEGIDIGHPATQAMLDGMANAGVLTNEEAAAVKALALQPASRAEIVCGVGSYVIENDLRLALESA